MPAPLLSKWLALLRQPKTHSAVTGSDAAVVNLRLADGDGSPLVGMLSKHGIPVVVTTGFSADQAPVGKAAAFLEKPYRESDLIETITRLTKTWRSR